jgi:hypothetical protein
MPASESKTQEERAAERSFRLLREGHGHLVQALKAWTEAVLSLLPSTTLRPPPKPQTPFDPRKVVGRVFDVAGDALAAERAVADRVIDMTIPAMRVMAKMARDAAATKRAAGAKTGKADDAA